ncbi:MAG: tRNA uridine(34) 5-carboxymethylaminomethyl modification radical SAM/GNAT enzyme Elp3 [Candidatus Moranbacteria bacterium]|nr:tRNA uridine(34) 5-carboxymethylaminomethyl modification radical SAM/GNAT enzyme Elp3 [Candidatus Moranbacteria bacterium]
MLKAYDNFIKLAMEAGVTDPRDFSRLKKDICKQLGVQPPTNADLREHYEKMITRKGLRRSLFFEKILLSKRVRTESGVAVVAVLTKSYPCPGKCIYCPSEKDMPKSYLSNEPAVMRAISAKFNPYKQVQNRLRALELNGHQIDKIELIVMGGTFSYLPKAYQTRFIKECFRACNEYGRKSKVRKVSKSVKSPLEKLALEQKFNEKAKCRIIGLTLETRPDYIDEQEILNFRTLGCTRVELGVQSVFDDVLKLNRRGHDIAKTIEATKLLKDAGFKINYHIMPGLPGSDLKRDYQMFHKLFSDSNFQPDMLKIYPTVVTKNTKLHSMWKSGKYKPLGNAEFAKFVLKIKKEIIPPYVRIARLVRDVPTSSIIAGPTISNLRQIIEKESVCPCIRCREVKSDYIIGENIILDRIDYPASNGKEIFLQYVSPASTRKDDCSSKRGGPDKRKLFALLRLRIIEDTSDPIGHPVSKLHALFPALKNSAIIREVHTYGKLTKIDKQNKTSPQHIGLGKKLLLEAERIAKKEFGLKKIAVISGVGVRGYYRKSGYKLRDTYLVKNI